MHRSWLTMGLMLTILAVWPNVSRAAEVADEGSDTAVQVSAEADGAAVEAIAAPATQEADMVSLAKRLAARAAGTQKAREDSDKARKSREIAFFRLDGEIPEVSDDLSLFGGRHISTMEKWLRRLAQARNDPKVSAIVLELGELEAGWAQVEELRGAIYRVHESGKPVYGFLTDGDLKNYVVASSCDQIILAPAGHLIIPGLRLQVWFYKDLMDKIGVMADILHIGAYKGAGEPYTRNGPSEELRLQYTGLTDDLYSQIIARVSESRNLPEDEVARLIDTALFSPKEAIEAKLVDRTMQLEDLFSELEEQDEATVNEEYGKKSREKPDFANPFAFFKILTQVAGKESESDKPAIGLILLDGMIVDKREDGAFETGVIAPEDVKEAVDAALDDDSIKAVVLRIDSPGGSALASDIMHDYILQLANAKPVIVSMGNVAASGGYYVACAGSTIVADPATITGSIGVLGGKIVIGGLLDKIGITTWSVRRGAMAGVFDSTSGFTPAERKKVYKLMNDIYGVFLERVLKARRDKLTKPIDEIAGGRVFTGQQAMELGLVDKLGGMTEAVYLAAEKAGIKSYQIRVVPKPKSFFETLFDDLLTSVDVEAEALSMNVGAVLPRGHDRASASIRKIVGRALLRIHLLQNHSVLAVLPFDTNLVP
jgi:protease IV